MTHRFPLKMSIPPDRSHQPGLALPYRQWRRLPDGSIEVIFNTPEQLETCITATQAIRTYEPKETDDRTGN